MTTTDYLIGIGFGGGYVALVALPLLVAAVVAFFPGNRPQRKGLFILVSGIVAFGLIGLAGVVEAPVEAVAMQFVPQWQEEGKETLARALGHVAEVVSWLPLVVAVVATVAVPLWLRLTFWRRLLPVLPNKSLNSTAAQAPSDAADGGAG